MNKFTILTTVFILLFCSLTTLNAQSPNAMSYQAVIRDNTNQLVTNQAIGMQISILKNAATGTAVYTETQTPTSNANGLVTLQIGTGTTTDDFSTIDWSTGNYFIKTETDVTGGTNYTITATSQLLSVPFAMYAKASGDRTFENGVSTNDAVYLTGNVGIGTNNPSVNLEVEGSTGIKYKGTSSEIRLTESGSIPIVEFNSINDQFSMFSIPSSNTNNRLFRFKYNSEPIGLVYRNGARLGIGVVNPNESLEVNGKTKTTNLQVTQNATAGHVLTADANGNATWQESSKYKFKRGINNITIGNLNFIIENIGGTDVFRVKTLSGTTSSRITIERLLNYNAGLIEPVITTNYTTLVFDSSFALSNSILYTNDGVYKLNITFRNSGSYLMFAEYYPN